jgi:hypothetical protein
MKSLHEVRLLAGAELSLKARLGYVALLLASTGMTAVVVALWLTEPVLPMRTQLAFGAMCVIGVSWVALAVWALRARRPLFARDRVIAGRMAVTFTAVFFTAAIVTVAMSANATGYGVVAMGAVMLGLAVKVLWNARRQFAALEARREQLEAMR